MADLGRRLLEPSERMGLDVDAIGGRMAHACGRLLTYVAPARSARLELSVAARQPSGYFVVECRAG